MSERQMMLLERQLQLQEQELKFRQEQADAELRFRREQAQHQDIKDAVAVDTPLRDSINSSLTILGCNPDVFNLL